MGVLIAPARGRNTLGTYTEDLSGPYVLIAPARGRNNPAGTAVDGYRTVLIAPARGRNRCALASARAFS